METTTTFNETSVNERPDYEMPIHAACDLFPLMDTEALAGLAADIRANGLVHRIVRHEGQLVDGRNRLLACRQAGVEPRFAEWGESYKGDMSLVRWIWSVNAKRRHMTPDQITAVEVALRAWEEQEAARQRQEEARRQQGEHGKEGGRGRSKPFGMSSPQRVSAGQGDTALPPRSPDKPGSSGRVREKLAKEIGTTEHKVRQALDVHKADPELLKQVARGALTLREAEKHVRTMATAAASRPAAAAAGQAEVHNNKRGERPPDHPPNKRQQIIEQAAKRRMIEGLSHIRGTCQGLFELNLPALRNASSAEEATTWAATARELSRQLRVFSSKLMPTKGEKQQ